MSDQSADQRPAGDCNAGGLVQVGSASGQAPDPRRLTADLHHDPGRRKAFEQWREIDPAASPEQDCVVASVHYGAEQVQRARTRDEQVMAGRSEIFLTRPQHLRQVLAVARIEVLQHMQEPAAILRIAGMHDIEVECRRGNSVKDGTHTADDDELDLGTRQGQEEPAEVGVYRRARMASTAAT
jgi:hypothetical protein